MNKSEHKRICIQSGCSVRDELLSQLEQEDKEIDRQKEIVKRQFNRNYAEVEKLKDQLELKEKMRKFWADIAINFGTEVEQKDKEIEMQSIQLSDMAGHITGMTCVMCNYLERATCYDQKTDLQARNDELEKVVEAAKDLMNFDYDLYVSDKAAGNYVDRHANTLALLDSLANLKKPRE